ncbi:S8 family peptidase [Metamycoplasma auris]|uniref:Subtilase family protein n=1 Tax=Metamycoplasma auris TaxID=51363 RepID=A0A2W7HXP0_9BACT|nr:S8 family peptidase [Metamycoplasma auris]PZV99955.1 subtilase family protein [Metamycoplasma auris]
MNPLLVLKGNFDSASNSSRMGNPKLGKDKSLNVEHIKKLLNDLYDVYVFWDNQTLKINPLVNVKYYSIAAKNKRISKLFYSTFKENNESIIGVSLIDENIGNNLVQKHLITYCINKRKLKGAIENIKIIIDSLEKNNIYDVTSELLEEILRKKSNIVIDDRISKTSFAGIIVDLSHIEEFSVKTSHDDANDNKVVTIYDVGVDAFELLKQLNISFNILDRIDSNTFYLDSESYNLLKERAPFLISMAVDDLNDFYLKNDDYNKISGYNYLTIPEPTNEPIIGVIDTMFDERVYFSKWVEFKKEISDEIQLTEEDYKHGTAVSSIIVDGPSFNNGLDDNCGRFRVRHFGVSNHKKASVLSLYNKIKNIVEKNKDIKVWNLSLGSNLEIEKNSISVMGHLLDKLQYENDVIFIVAGTNKDINETKPKKIGSPADSMNAIVVNSVDYNNKPAKYSRMGPVLHFFRKPDVSYYGGTNENPLVTCIGTGEYKACGTSFAAPWIARKVAYLIHILNLSKEEAKALIINTAIPNEKDGNILGYGVVPIKINDIIESKNYDIRIILSSQAKQYHTFTHEFPVPTYDNAFPFTVKATLVYSADTNRKQGVDYTNNELDFQFGPMVEKKEKRKIKTINDNNQSNHDDSYTYEKEAWKEFSKWNNVKVVERKETSATGVLRKAIKVKDNSTSSWGINITKKNRLDIRSNKEIKFSIVITLKGIDKNRNHLEKFINLCKSSLRWNVDKIDIDNKINVFSQSNEEIKFES